MKNFILVLALSMIAATGCNDQVKEPSEPPVVVVPPVATPVGPVVPGQWQKPPFPLKDFMFLHLQGLSDLKKNLRQTELVNLELNDIMKNAKGDPAIVPYVKSRGIYAVAYTSTTIAKYHFDYASAPKQAYTVINKDFPDEWWPNANKYLPESVAFIKTRIKKISELGFQAVEVDNLDVGPNAKSYGITTAQNEKFVKELIDYAHSLGLAFIFKNGSEMHKNLAQYADGLINESCMAYDECEDATKYFWGTKKPIMLMFYKGKCYKHPDVSCSPDSLKHGYFVDL